MLPMNIPTRTYAELHQRMQKRIRLQLYGWILFILCALLFVAESVRNQELLLLLGSLIFLLGCLVFIAPIIETLRQQKNAISRQRF